MSHDELTPLRTNWSALASALGVIAAVTGHFPMLVGTVPVHERPGAQRVSLRLHDFTEEQVQIILDAMPTVTEREHCNSGTWIRTLEGELAECWPVELFEIFDGPAMQGPEVAIPTGGWISGGCADPAPTATAAVNVAGWLEPRPSPFPRNRDNVRWGRAATPIRSQV